MFALFAQFKVNSAFNKYSKHMSKRGITGAEVAEYMLRMNEINDVSVERSEGGGLSDHYDPRTNVIRLSKDVYSSSSIAAIGIAAHEAGHAIQYAKGYSPIKVRSAIIPITRVGSTLAWPLLLIGLILSSQGLVTAGIIFFSASTLFQLVTLPVEFNASNRAMEALSEGGILEDSELHGARKTLSAAAMTYLAALAVSIAQLLRLILLFGGGRRRN